MGQREEDEIVIYRASLMICKMLNVKRIPPPLFVDWPEIYKDDRVKAISDGALYLVTDKLCDRTKSGCRSIQYAMLSFEAKQPENSEMSG